DDIDAAVSQVQRVRVALAAVADDRDASSIETADIGVSIVEKARHFSQPPSACDHHGRVTSSAGSSARRAEAPSAIAKLPDHIVSQAPNPLARSIISP